MLTARDGQTIANTLRDFAENPENKLSAMTRQGVEAAANRLASMTPEQLNEALNQRTGPNNTGPTVRDLLTSDDPVKQIQGTLNLIRKNINAGLTTVPSGPAVAPSSPVISNPTPSGPANARQVIDALRSGNAAQAAAALDSYADQQRIQGQMLNHGPTIRAANVNDRAADAMRGPNGQQRMDAILNMQLGNTGKTVRDMLNSPNENTQALAATLVANGFGNQPALARQNLALLTNAAEMERNGITTGMNGVGGMHGGVGGTNVSHGVNAGVDRTGMGIGGGQGF